MFHTITHSRLLIVEFYTLYQRILAVFANISEDETDLKMHLQRLQDKFNVLDSIVNKTSTKIATEKIHIADLKRINAYQALKWHILSLTKRSDITIREAGNVLLNALENYGLSLQKRGLTEKSAILDNLIGDMETNERIVAAVTTGGATELLASLKTCHQGFILEQQDRTDLKTDNLGEATLVVRHEIQKLSDELFQYLEVMQRISPSDQRLDWVDHINIIIDEIMAVVRARQTRNSHNGEEEEGNNE